MGLIGFTKNVELKDFHGQNMFVQRMGKWKWLNAKFVQKILVLFSDSKCGTQSANCKSAIYL
jgi:hypothetical protein